MRAEAEAWGRFVFMAVCVFLLWSPASALAKDDWEKYGQIGDYQQTERKIDMRSRELDKYGRDEASAERSRELANKVLQDIAQCHGAEQAGVNFHECMVRRGWEITAPQPERRN